MRVPEIQKTAVLLAGLCWMIAPEGVHAGNDIASQHATMRHACAKHGGRFELSWMYNDQGVRWGRVLSCSTSIGYIRCQSNNCRASRWVLRDGAEVDKDGRAKGQDATRFPAEASAFSDALAVLAGN